MRPGRIATMIRAVSVAFRVQSAISRPKGGFRKATPSDSRWPIPPQLQSAANDDSRENQIGHFACSRLSAQRSKANRNSRFNTSNNGCGVVHIIAVPPPRLPSTSCETQSRAGRILLGHTAPHCRLREIWRHRSNPLLVQSYYRSLSRPLTVLSLISVSLPRRRTGSRPPRRAKSQTHCLAPFRSLRVNAARCPAARAAGRIVRVAVV